MPEILTDSPIVLTVPQEYGGCIEAMEVSKEKYCPIPEEHRRKILNYIKRKYADTRTYTTRKEGDEIRLYRLK